MSIGFYNLFRNLTLVTQSIILYTDLRGYKEKTDFTDYLSYKTEAW